MKKLNIFGLSDKMRYPQKNKKKEEYSNYSLGKKGSHTGVIISFVIFIASLLVIYAIIDIPSNDSIEKKHSIDLLKSNILNEISQDLIVVRLHDTSKDGACVKFATPSNSFSILDYIAINSSNEMIKITGFAHTTFIENGNNLTKIYYTNNSVFTDSVMLVPIGCIIIKASSTSYENQNFEKLIIGIVNDTKEKYYTTKFKLEVPDSDEFDLEFTYSDDRQIGGIDSNNIATNIYVSEYRISYISLNGTEETGTLKVSLW